MNCKKILTDMMTESDNRTHDVFRYLAVLSVLVGLGLAIFSVGWKGQSFDMIQFGTGIGTLFGGVGVALKLRHDNEISMKRLEKNENQE